MIQIDVRLWEEYYNHLSSDRYIDGSVVAFSMPALGTLKFDVIG